MFTGTALRCQDHLIFPAKKLDVALQKEALRVLTITLVYGTASFWTPKRGSPHRLTVMLAYGGASLRTPKRGSSQRLTVMLFYREPHKGLRKEGPHRPTVMFV